MSCYVILDTDSDTHRTRDPDPEDSWDRGNTSTTWYVNGAHLSPVDAYGESCVYPGELKLGDTVYCVYAVYSTGDTFGSDRNRCLEFLSVHKNAELAHENARRLKEGEKDDDGCYFIRHDDGTIIPMMYVPWEGYFESLSYIQVDSFVLSEKRVSKRY